MVANSANSGEFYTSLPIVWHPWQPWVHLHMEVQIYYRIWNCGEYLSKISLCVMTITLTRSHWEVWPKFSLICLLSILGKMIDLSFHRRKMVQWSHTPWSSVWLHWPPLGCANKDLDGFFGPLCKFIEYCRIVALLPVIPLGIMNNW